jgi:site-specific recombinase XerD
MANKRLKSLKALFAFASEANLVQNDPTIGVRKIRYVSSGHHRWTEGEIGQFEQCHPIGTRARLALDLIRYTTGRREDAVRLGPQHIRDGRVVFRQAKLEHRNPVDLDIPAHPELLASIAAAPSGHLTFLTTAYGKPFTPAGFGNWFRDRCNEAGLPHCSAHGLRKATATALAEGGATPHEIMAVTGHRSIAEAQRYTEEAQRKRLATSAMEKLRR